MTSIKHLFNNLFLAICFLSGFDNRIVYVLLVCGVLTESCFSFPLYQTLMYFFLFSNHIFLSSFFTEVCWSLDLKTKNSWILFLQETILRGIHQLRSQWKIDPQRQQIMLTLSCGLTLWLGFSGDSVVKNPHANTEDTGGAGSIPGSEKYPGVGNSNPLQCCCLKNSMDRGAWWAVFCGGGRGPKESGMIEQLSTHTYT